jgi:RND family efflux transporter MFP subunit
VGSLVLALAGAAAAAGAAPLTGCLIEPERIAEVGSPVAGVIQRVEVERGQRVRRGQVLAVLQAEVERANVDVARSRADAQADLDAAAANASFNRDRLVRAEDLFRQSFISQQALDQARTEARLADQKLKLAREQRAISRQERDVAEAQLSQRIIRSPMDGVVAERYASAGERADDKPLLRIARIDPLRVQLVVPTSLYGQLRVGGRVGISPELPGAVALTARVTMVDKVIDPASNTFRVQLELPNPDFALPAGLRCKAVIDAAALAAAPAPPADPRTR